jgi:hypothetical protein
VNSAHRPAIFRLVASSNGLAIRLDYNTPAIDEMSRMRKFVAELE